MKLNKNLLFIGLFVILFVAVSSMSFAQCLSSEIWIRGGLAYPAGSSESNLMWFGNHINARFNPVDTIPLQLGRPDTSTIKEKASPPLPPGMGVVWMNIKNRPANPYGGNGLLTYDFRGIPQNVAKKDTFHLYIQAGFSTDSADTKIKWPSASYLDQRCDSIIINYLDPDLGQVWINMKTVDSLVIPLGSASGMKDFWIYKWGYYMVDACPTGVQEIARTIPSDFALYQNYPNPFNPSTTIRFDIEKSAMTDITVYNLLGQKIATLISQEFSPGTYSTTWNGVNSQGAAVASGVYYIRMTARQNASQGNSKEFSALQKLLLLK